MKFETAEKFLTYFTALLGVTLTEEQEAFAKDITSPVYLQASPGTGKTFTSINALYCAELFHQIPGESIYALSFTNNATAEMAIRYRDVAKRMHLRDNVNFQTLHSMFKEILDNYYAYLEMDRVDIQDADMEELVDLIVDVAEEKSIPIERKSIPKIVRTIHNMNGALQFEQTAIENSQQFKELGITYDTFMFVRHLLYGYAKRTNTIDVSDILMYTLELLMRFPEVCEKEKKKHRIILVDEAQDLSLLELLLLSHITDTLVIVGDPKQQIFAFSGACQEVFSRYAELFPTARKLYLSQSFRCKNEIADFATKIILANNIEGSDEFVGTGSGGRVLFKQHLNIKRLCDDLAKEYAENHEHFAVDRMFLFRNNDLGVAIVDELFQRGLPFRTKGYTGAHNMVVIKDLCEIVNLCLNPGTPSNAYAFTYLIPEFTKYSDWSQIPLAKICRDTGYDMFSINYNFTNPAAGASAMGLLLEVREMLNNNESCSSIFNKIWPMYYERYLEKREYLLPNIGTYYAGLVAPLTRKKTYSQFVKDELEKISQSKKNAMFSEGVRCYTFHGSKGLEAEEVYLLSANEGVLPNQSTLKRMRKYKDNLAIAREVRSERFLCYVAATRAKNTLIIDYDVEVSRLFKPELGNPYEAYDNLYTDLGATTLDVTAFEEFVQEEIKC